jgi:hypothetical protein
MFVILGLFYSHVSLWKSNCVFFYKCMYVYIFEGLLYVVCLSIDLCVLGLSSVNFWKLVCVFF